MTKNSPRSLTSKQIDAVEHELNFRFPASLREAYVQSNGGSPDRCIFQSQVIDTAVSEFLPLLSDKIRPATATYKYLVLEKKLVPPHYFPFAVDSGGDYFFVDCSVPCGRVFLLRHDTIFERVIDTGLTHKEFIDFLRQEDD